MGYKRGKNHGYSKTRIYRCWQAMKARCYQPNNWKYPIYHAKGIKVCDEWRDDFLAFRRWALANGYNDELTLDRINNDGNYEPSNCRWATAFQQNNNSSHNNVLEYNGEKHSVSEWSEIVGIPYNALENRVFRGWSTETALTTPLPNRYLKVR